MSEAPDPCLIRVLRNRYLGIADSAKHGIRTFWATMSIHRIQCRLDKTPHETSARSQHYLYGQQLCRDLQPNNCYANQQPHSTHRLETGLELAGPLSKLFRTGVLLGQIAYGATTRLVCALWQFRRRSLWCALGSGILQTTREIGDRRFLLGSRCALGSPRLGRSRL